MLFSDVFVNDVVKKKLINTVINQRVSHTQLFLGTEGSHTLALAIAYAQYINCKNRSATDACGVCESCVKYRHLAHPDLHFYFPTATNNTVKDKPISSDFYDEWREMLISSQMLFTENDWYQKLELESKQAFINVRDVEDIIYKASMKPYESEYKVFIIWMVDKLRHDGAPRLLKTLEEPDGKTLFILITENQEKIIDTILSRAQLVKVNKLNTEEITNAFIEKFACDRDTARKIAFASDNNLIEAFRLYKNEQNDNEDLKLFVQLMRVSFMLSSNNTFDFNLVTDYINEIEKLGRERQKSFLRYAIMFVRKCIFWDYELEQIVKYTPEEKDWIIKFKPYIDRHNGPFYYKYFNESIKHIQTNASAKILFTDLMFQIVTRFSKKVKSA
ncbi:MAG: hypothetical protein KBA86_02300 [Bacteroidales bacterium]|nr:hypothetical protein [Bacteroidales bacterium]